MANNSSVHKVASYNISFASDLGTFAFGSEKHFVSDTLKRLDALGRKEELTRYGQRAAWENAARLVRDFWLHQDPSVMGLQEMNTSDKIGNNNRGTERLKTILADIKDIKGRDNLRFYHNYVQKGNTFPTVMTIWNSDKLGEIKHAYTADFGDDNGFNLIPDELHKGRPISIVYTDKGFTLINLHGPNWSEESYKGGMGLLRAAIDKHIHLFFDNQPPILNHQNNGNSNGNGRNHNNNGTSNERNSKRAKDNQASVAANQARPILDPNKLFVMGDFNDPFNAIKHSTPLVIRGTPLYYNNSDQDKVKSCCYNFNSSCPEGDLNDKGEPEGYNQGIRETRGDRKADPYECFIKMDPGNRDLDETLWGNIKTTEDDEIEIMGNKIPIPGLSVGKRGHLANYRFTGDYVMGATVVQPLRTYRPDGFLSPVSFESDHEMVFATFRSSVGGGRRKRRTHRKKHTRRTRHKRHTRRK